MIFLLAFWGFFIGSIILSWRAGDGSDRRVIIGISLAAATTSFVHLVLPNRAASVATFTVDLALLAFVVRYAMVSRRHWPIWFAGFHGAALVLGFASLLLTDGPLVAALRIGAFWSLPALLAMTVGLTKDLGNGVTQPARSPG